MLIHLDMTVELQPLAAMCSRASGCKWLLTASGCWEQVAASCCFFENQKKTPPACSMVTTFNYTDLKIYKQVF